MEIDRETVMTVMRRSLARCIDKGTRELDRTRLAEVAAERLNLYEDDDGTVPQELFDIAAEFDETVAAAAGYIARATGARWDRGSPGRRMLDSRIRNRERRFLAGHGFQRRTRARQSAPFLSRNIRNE